MSKSADFRSRPATAIKRVDSLSGGTQQKIVLAKALLTEPGLLILDEPTRGIDIGAKTEIYAIISRLAAEGQSDYYCFVRTARTPVLGHRILVMREGASRPNWIRGIPRRKRF